MAVRILAAATAVVLAAAFAGCLKVESGKDKSREEPQVQGQVGNRSIEVNK